VFRAALDAMVDLPVHALLTVGTGMDTAALGATPGNVTVEAFVPQAQVFPHAAAVLNHGGSGTVLGALAAGIPMVIAPPFADQPHNARSVAATGAGVAAFTPAAVSIRDGVEKLLATPEMRIAAGRLAAEMAALPDIDAALDMFLALARACLQMRSRSPAPPGPYPRCSFTGSDRPRRRKCAMKGRVESSSRVAA
jgi:UDP:flavonoid glycosyltransferase YjiC (YdhE family)